MIIGVGSNNIKERILTIGTHNGIFHEDDVAAVTIYELANYDKPIAMVRTRDYSVLSQLDIVFDVGGGIYDHHSPGFNEKRPTGELYASAGLAWKIYGEKVIKNVAEDLKAKLTDDDIKEIKEKIDLEVILPIDQEDNGVPVPTHIFSFIPTFIPSWMESPEYDEAFEDVVKIVRRILVKIIKTKISEVAAKYKLADSYESAENGILEIAAQTMPWLESVVSYNAEHDNEIKFVIFPYPDGGWAAQCVPPSIERKMEQLVPFPKAWAGGNEKTLPEVSGISDAKFCHKFRFFARAESRESVIRMCKIAMETK